MSGSVTKLIILSFDDSSFTIEDPDKQFTAPINPETFTRSFKIAADKRQAHGSAGTNPQYISSPPEELKLEFMLDGTGTMQGYYLDPTLSELSVSQSVPAQLNQFLNCTYDMDGNIHRPRFLYIIWGQDMNFQCTLTSVDVNFTLMDANGDPLRAKLSASFLGYYTPQELLQQSRMSSPDLTKLQKVNQGDSLDLLAYQQYDDPMFFMQLGRVNNLTSIRNIKPGTTLKFPPINKNTN